MVVRGWYDNFIHLVLCTQCETGLAGCVIIVLKVCNSSICSLSNDNAIALLSVDESLVFSIEMVKPLDSKASASGSKIDET